MKTKTQDLIGPALDWAVAKCEGRENDGTWDENFSINWLLGGPIIEREKIDLRFDGEWIALAYGIDYDAAGMPDEYPHGPTPLIAAMRCYVASVLGNEVEVPEELQ